MKRRFLFVTIILLSFLMIGCTNQVAESGSIVISLPYGTSRVADDVSYTYVLDFLFADSTTIHDEQSSGSSLVYDEIPAGNSSVAVKVYNAEKTKLIYSGETEFVVMPGKTVPVDIKVSKAGYNTLKWKTSDYICFNNPDWSLLTVQRFLDEDQIDAEYVKADELFDFSFADTLTENVNYAGYVPVVLTSKDNAFTTTVSIPMVVDFEKLALESFSIKYNAETKSFIINNSDIKVTYIDEKADSYEWSISVNNKYEWYEDDKLIEEAKTNSYAPFPYLTSTVYCKITAKPVVDVFAEILGDQKLFNKDIISIISEKMAYTPNKTELIEEGNGYRFEVEYPESDYYYSCRANNHNNEYLEFGFDIYLNSVSEPIQIKNMTIFIDGNKVNFEEVSGGYSSGYYEYNNHYCVEYPGGLKFGLHEILCFITLENGDKVTMRTTFEYYLYN